MGQSWVNHPASFRDKDGFVIEQNGSIFRVVTSNYKVNYDALNTSGLYAKLTDKLQLVSHQEVDDFVGGDAYKIIKPQQIPFISYPYEWSFNQLKQAALLTLDIQIEALNHQMTLKDASAFNVQFVGKKPIFIDTTSFEMLEPNKPWVAYGQFCRHFLAPLSLMAYTDLRLLSLATNFIEGIPLDLCAKLLPTKSKFNLGVLTHIHLHAKSVSKHESTQQKVQAKSISINALKAIVGHLKTTVDGLKIKSQKTEWDDYYTSNNNYTNSAFTAKKKWIELQLEKMPDLDLVWDMGANDGYFSKVASTYAKQVVAMDIDPNAINRLASSKETPDNLLPLVIDLTNPTPSIGWATIERDSIYARKKPDLITALALIHHLVIGNNVSFEKVAGLLANQTNQYLIIEFVDVEDSQVKKLTLNRPKQNWEHYHLDGFKLAFEHYFLLEQQFKVPEAERFLFLFRKK
jgi:ribosomal protein L11 methylase PrmA